MNFIDKFFLRLVMLPTSFYNKLGVDMSQLLAILAVKLTMDNRRPAAFGGARRRNEKKEINGATLKMMLSSLFMGLIMLYVFFVGNDMFTKLSLFMTMFIFMVCITLITDFTSVLIDIRDNLIILPKPISDGTFMTARLLHIAIRTSIVVLPLSVPALVTATVMQGSLIILPFILMIILMTLLSIFLINAVYLLILKITTPVKFQNIIGSIQIAFVMVVMVGYQVLPRMMQSSAMQHLSVSDLPYARFVPSVWFADSCVMLSGGGFSILSVVSLALSTAVPVFSIWLVIKYFAPSFNQKLALITGGTSEQSASQNVSATDRKKGSKTTIAQRVACWLTKPGAERAGFLFAFNMATRSRDFKMKAYPSFGLIVVMSFVFLFQNNGLSDISAPSLKIAPKLLMVMYFCCMPLYTALMQLTYSEKFRASWMFFVTPVENPGLIISGSVKCLIFIFLVPLMSMIVVLGLAIQGFSILPNLLFGCVNLLAIDTFFAYIIVRKLPFSTAYESAKQGTTFIKTMLFMIAPVAFGMVHWFLSGFQWVILLLIVISSVAVWLVFDEIKKRDWASLT